jgi:D-lyxose ketol-isomerase
LKFHRHELEDIINRGGDNLLIRLYKATAEGQCSDESFTMQVDGVSRPIKAGDILR